MFKKGIRRLLDCSISGYFNNEDTGNERVIKRNLVKIPTSGTTKSHRMEIYRTKTMSPRSFPTKARWMILLNSRLMYLRNSHRKVFTPSESASYRSLTRNEPSRKVAAYHC